MTMRCMCEDEGVCVTTKAKCSKIHCGDYAVMGFRLQDYGIIPLTGEACAYGMRILYDLTPSGVEVISRFLGGNVQFKDNSNWNSGAVASVMIPYSAIRDLERFVMLGHSEDRNVHQMSGREV